MLLLSFLTKRSGTNYHNVSTIMSLKLEKLVLRLEKANVLKLLRGECDLYRMYSIRSSEL